jgi:flagellar motor switch protein FliG
MSELASVQGYQRVAAFLLSLEPAVASSVLKGMPPEVVARVAQAMIDLDPRLTGKGVVEELYRALGRDLHGPKAVGPCDTDHLRKLLGDAFGKQADELLRAIQERRLASRPFLELERHPPAALARVLREESAAVAALVLAHVEPAQAALVLKSFEPAAALEVVRRMVTLEAPAPELLRTLAADLAQRLARAPLPAAAAGPEQRLQSVAELLNNSPPEMEKKVIEELAQQDEKTANELRERLFSWEDIGALNRRAMTKILGTVDTKTLSVALKGCSRAVEQNILGNLSSRVRDMVAEERELAGPLPLSDVKIAREEILKSIRALIEAGEFRPNRGGDELVE